MKMSKRDRKMFNQGKQFGYAEGYAKGYHDGNPFNTMIEAITSLAINVSEAIKENPELLKELKQEWNKPHMLTIDDAISDEDKDVEF